MSEAVHVALEDCFIDDKNMDARKFVFGLLKQQCQDAKSCERDKITPSRQRQEDGSYQIVEHKFDGVLKYDGKKDPNWLPDNLTPEENNPVIIKLGIKSEEFLPKYAALAMIRHHNFIDSEQQFIDSSIKGMISDGIDEKTIEKTKASYDNMQKERLKTLPKSFEEILFGAVWIPITQKLNVADAKMFDAEYEESYPVTDVPTPQ